MNILKKLVLSLLVIGILLAGVLYGSLELAVHYAEQKYAELSPGNRLTIGGWQLNPASAEFSIRDVRVEYSADDKPSAVDHLDELYLKLSLPDLFDKILVIEVLRINSLATTARVNNSRLIVSGIDVTDFVAEQIPAGYQHQLQLSLQQLTLDSGDITPLQQQINNILLNELQLKLDGDPVLSFESYQLRNINLSEQLLDIGQHLLSGLSLKVVKEADGKLRGFGPLMVTEQAPSTATPLELSKEEPQNSIPATQEGLPDFVLHSFTMAGENTLRFIDNSAKDVADNRLVINLLKLGAIDSRDPDAETTIQLQASTDEYSSIAIDAKGHALAPEKQSYVNLKIEQLNLVPFNPYVNQQIGYHLDSGQLNSEADVTIQNSRLAGELIINLQGIVMEPSDQELSAKISKKISMPLDTALSILRDDNDNIRLTMPIKGDLNDPNIGFDDLTAQISQTAMKAALMHYFKQSLQPYGALVSLGSLAGDYLLTVRLEPLQFQAGQYELLEDQHQYLNKVMAMMADKETLQLKVCPFAYSDELSLPDLKALKGEAITDWKQLASQRANSIKRYMKQQRPDLTRRIVLCQPQQDEGLAKVELGF